MPLLNDAKACYVGNQPITTIMAGSVQVWPKGPPPPFRAIALYVNSQDNIQGAVYLSWAYGERPASCVRATVYEYRSTSTDIPWGANNIIEKRPWLPFGYASGCNAWMPKVGGFNGKMITYIAAHPVPSCTKISAQLRHTLNGVVTTSEEIIFDKYEFVSAEDGGSWDDYPQIPEDAKTTPCPVDCIPSD